jgi:hypothetical protein
MNVCLPILFAVLFAFAHTQSPLYYSNQNQYFLSGLADGGVGNLSADWLANTADPVPAFSAFVAFCVRYLGTWPFHAMYFVALMGYFLALWWLVRKLPFAPSENGQWVVAVLLIVSHAGIVRFASERWLGADYPWFFHCGLASQYVLGPGLQPSVIGVLLVAAVAAYLNERPVLAAGMASGANLIHATYLLPAAMLIVGFLVGEVLRKRWRSAVVSAILALLLVLPTVVYDLRTFAPTDSKSFAESQRILVEIRIPHHAQPARWFDWVAGVQVIWMLLGLVAVRRTRLFVPFCVTYSLVAVGTLAVIVTNHLTLSLLFPWRVTAVLVPVSTAVLAAWVNSGLERLATKFTATTKWVEASPRFSFVRLGLFVVSLFSALSGIVVMVFHLGYREPEYENPVLEHVARTRQPGDLYLVPAKIPKPSAARGVYSNTFVRPPAANRPGIFEIARFRLATGAPVFVDFKSIPYRDDEVLEWYRRVAATEKWYTHPDWDANGAFDEITREGITHVVAPTSVNLNCSRLELVFEGGAYRVYVLRSRK